MPCLRHLVQHVVQKTDTRGKFRLALPSRFRRTLIWVSRVLRAIWAWRMDGYSETTVILTQLRATGGPDQQRVRVHQTSPRRASSSASHCASVPTVILKNGAIRGRMAKISHQYATLAQPAAQIRAHVARMARQNKIRQPREEPENLRTSSPATSRLRLATTRSQISRQ